MKTGHDPCVPDTDTADRWRATFDAISDFACVLSRDHEFLEINRAGCEALGLSREEILGRKCHGLVHGSPEPIMECPCLHSLQTSRPATREYEADGRHYELTAWPILKPGGEVDAFVHLVSDITRRKREEAGCRLFRMLVDHANDEFEIIDPETAQLLDVNSQSCSQLGYTREELLGMTVFDIDPLVTPEVFASCMDHRHDITDTTIAPHGHYCVPIARGKKVYGVLTTYLPDGHERSDREEVFLRAVADALAGVLARRGAEEEKRRVADQLRQSQRLEAVGQLAGGVAHDFNNQLTVIQTFTEFALDGLPPSDPIRADLEEVQQAGQRSAALTRQLLAFSRKQILEPVVLDVDRTIGGLEGMMRRLLGEDIDFQVCLDAKQGRIEADPGQIEQVVVNLAINARDAMPEGGTLTIETSCVELDEAYARQHIAVTPGPFMLLSVTDTGCGMDPETQAHIFEPFFTTKELGKGTGLGLSTVYGIVKQSHGSIWVYSEIDQGTTFKVYLPRVDAAVAEKRPLDEPGSATGDETVLIVEDEEAIRRIAERILSKAGYRVHTAASGAQALSLSESLQDEVDLLLTDVVMPKMSGRQLAGQLGKRFPSLKVLYMSGYTDNGRHRGRT